MDTPYTEKELAERGWKIEFIRGTRGLKEGHRITALEEASNEDLDTLILKIVQRIVKTSEIIALYYIRQHWFEKRYGASA